MSDLFDEYPMLIFALESLLALFLLVFIVVWTSSGKKKTARANQLVNSKSSKNRSKASRRTRSFLKTAAAPPVQCNVRGIRRMNSGTGASNRSPSSATQKYSPRIVPTGVAITAQLVYSKCSPGLSSG